MGERQPRGRWRYSREDGLEFERVAFFTDAMFAIAMTLLIVAVATPVLVGDGSRPGTMLAALGDLAPALISFFLAFLLLSRYWMAHHEFFASLRKVDRSFISWNLCYLAFVAFLPFPTSLIGTYEENPIAVVLFALCLAAISGLECVLFRIAYRHGLMRIAIDDRGYRYGMLQSALPVVLFVVSIPIAFWNTTIALVSWVLSIPLGMVIDRSYGGADMRDLFAPDDDG